MPRQFWEDDLPMEYSYSDLPSRNPWRLLNKELELASVKAERDAAAVIVNMVRSWFADQPPDQPGCECEACKLIRAVAVYDQRKKAPATRPTGDGQ